MIALNVRLTSVKPQILDIYSIKNYMRTFIFSCHLEPNIALSLGSFCRNVSACEIVAKIRLITSNPNKLDQIKK